MKLGHARALVALSLAISALACAPVAERPPPTAADRGAALDLSRLELVDLSHVYDDATLYWPTSPQRFEIETLTEGTTEAGFFYSAKLFSTPE
ncbi:MAG: hypothetical protein R3244_12445, partial [Thermoanaerobaculia bacterium]|nr:hypothetical protein [Thermoanaerobaculia bacterium]